jgi:hypothetical protein
MSSTKHDTVHLSRGSLVLGAMVSRRTWLRGIAHAPIAILLACSKKLEKDSPPTVSVETSWDSILLGAADAILGLPIPDHGHYKSFFDWRFKNVAPYRDVYLRLATALEKRSQQVTRASFVSAKLETRDEIVSDVLDHDPGAADFDSYFRAEVLALFAKTDVLVMLGYDSWPGVARGFEGLQAPPTTRAL